MSSEVVLQFTEVSKTYPPQRTPLIQLWNQLRGRHGTTEGSFHALKPLSLQIKRGQSLGIVGLNGAGKSTLLQLAAGTLTPSTGQVVSRGRVAALLELGSGFNPEATGRENIYLYAATMGMGRSQVADRIDSIIEFSGLRDALDMPVKTYSSGMQVRLAFSVATSVDP
ncbi:MAG: ABC transporter ATP-binding protein, partial [Acidovorax defluvii]